MDRGRRRYTGEKRQEENGDWGKDRIAEGIHGEIYYAEESERNEREPFRSLTHFVPGAAHVSCLYFSTRNVDIHAEGVRGVYASLYSE